MNRAIEQARDFLRPVPGVSSTLHIYAEHVERMIAEYDAVVAKLAERERTIATLRGELTAAREWAQTMERERDWEYDVVQPDLTRRAEAAERRLAAVTEELAYDPRGQVADAERFHSFCHDNERDAAQRYDRDRLARLVIELVAKVWIMRAALAGSAYSACIDGYICKQDPGCLLADVVAGSTVDATERGSGPDPGSFGGHPYTPDEIALGYGTDHDPRDRKHTNATEQA